MGGEKEERYRRVVAGVYCVCYRGNGIVYRYGFGF